MAPEERGIFYFTHSGTLLKLLAFLRLYEGETGPLTSAGYIPGRDWAWRTSRLSPFGANVAFALQQCGPGGQFKVGLFVNEQLGKCSDLAVIEYFVNIVNKGFFLLLSGTVPKDGFPCKYGLGYSLQF